MDPATVAVAAAALFFSEALKEGGKALGKEVAELSGKFVALIRSKFKAAGTEGLLNRAENDPNEKNRQKVLDELQTQLEEDPEFAAQLQALLADLNAAGVVKQVMGTDLEVEETLEVKTMSQSGSGAGNVDQEMLTRTKAKNIKIGEMNQGR
jgi:hypothetical protein